MSSRSIPVRATIGMFIVGLLLSFGTAPSARAASGDTAADGVLGQPDFVTVESSNRPVTAATMYQP